MTSKRLTLAEQLSQIAEPAPQDYDPEDSYATYGAEKGETSGTRKKDLEAGRAEYVDVGASKLRKKGEAIYDAKYAGKKGSRKELYGNDNDSQDSGSDSEEEDEDDDEEDEEEMGDSEDLEAELQGGSEDDDSEDDDEEEEPESEVEVERVIVKTKKEKKSPGKKSSSKSSTTTTTTAEDEKAMLKQMKQAASADVEKGRDVKKQLAFCDNLLESRIKIQKSLTAVNSLPQTDKASTYFSLLPEELAETLAEVELMNEELFALRREMLTKNESIELSSNFGALRKRKRGGTTTNEYLNATLTDLATLETALEPYLRTTITKWSDKVLAASGLALGQNKKFKAVNQNIMQQIDHALGSSERDRLVKRTRVKRGGGAVVGKVEEVILEGEKGGVDEEIFDDGDFYQQLLRDVVESRMLDLDDPTLESLRLASARGKKQKKVVDTRASKGRKIRYHVHEKLQSFMVPIEAASWHEEQVDELFASLLGRSFPLVKNDDDDSDILMGGADGGMNGGGEKVEVGALRIFG